ncbi:MAG: GWxTD domain-containing protein [Ignavibacteria bacterium]|nr:GWxTD domain-containing protein [Ignavibacteria bacterium]
MKFSLLIFLFVTELICSSNGLMQKNFQAFSFEDEEKTILHLKGLEALKARDTLNAESLFKDSIRKFNDAASHYLLAQILLNRNTFNSRDQAFEHLRSAVMIKPDNLEYRFAFANLMKDFARISSFEEFKKIIEMDSSQVQAWISLGEMKARDFSEFNKSVRDMGEIYGSLQEYADKDYEESEKYFLAALSKDSLNYDAILNLSLLYEKVGKSEYGIPLLKKLVRHTKDDKKIHLCLGLLNYKNRNIEEAHKEYQIAISLMSEDEKKDFIFNSVKMMLDPVYQGELNLYSEEELIEFFNTYWKASDPLYLTDQNERLIEHYSRVAYANLNYGIPSKGVIGWKSNMGETVIRYGEPIDRMRIRPQFNNNGIGMKTEVWHYKDMTFAFSDLASSGNFQFVWPAGEKDKLVPQVAGNFHDYAEYLRTARPTYYIPKFEGPNFTTEFSISQFKSNERRNHTDVLLTYKIEAEDSLFEKGITELNHKIGFYFFDKNYDELIKKIDEQKIYKNNNSVNRNLIFTARPDSGVASFEMIRELDKGVSTNKIPLKINKFSSDRLDISNIVFASDVSSENLGAAYFERDGLFIKQKTSNNFGIKEQFFIYFEIYNLKKDEEGLTNFEQSITISEVTEEKFGLEKFFTSIAEFIGLTSNEKITLSSNYKTLVSDPKIYFQLDFSRYQAGNYLVTVKIKDNIKGIETEVSKPLTWINDLESN